MIYPLNSSSEILPFFNNDVKCFELCRFIDYDFGMNKKLDECVCYKFTTKTKKY